MIILNWHYKTFALVEGYINSDLVCEVRFDQYSRVWVGVFPVYKDFTQPVFLSRLSMNAARLEAQRIVSNYLAKEKVRAGQRV